MNTSKLAVILKYLWCNLRC